MCEEWQGLSSVCGALTQAWMRVHAWPELPLHQLSPPKCSPHLGPANCTQGPDQASPRLCTQSSTTTQHTHSLGIICGSPAPEAECFCQSPRAARAQHTYSPTMFRAAITHLHIHTPSPHPVLQWPARVHATYQKQVSNNSNVSRKLVGKRHRQLKLASAHRPCGCLW